MTTAWQSRTELEAGTQPVPDLLRRSDTGVSKRAGYTKFFTVPDRSPGGANRADRPWNLLQIGVVSFRSRSTWTATDQAWRACKISFTPSGHDTACSILRCPTSCVGASWSGPCSLLRTTRRRCRAWWVALAEVPLDPSRGGAGRRSACPVKDHRIPSRVRPDRESAGQFRAGGAVAGGDAGSPRRGGKPCERAGSPGGGSSSNGPSGQGDAGPGESGRAAGLAAAAGGLIGSAVVAKSHTCASIAVSDSSPAQRRQQLTRCRSNEKRETSSGKNPWRDFQREPGRG